MLAPWIAFVLVPRENAMMTRTFVTSIALAAACLSIAARADEKDSLNTPPEGFTALFNGKDLTNWRGLAAPPPKLREMSKEELAKAQEEADQKMKKHWKVEDGVLVFDGMGDNLCTVKDYGDFELYVDWKIEPKGDSGIYLRG